ncbi:MAG: AI-2E family transporter [Dokdonella sp.]|nr:AI-2E family transporter [Dokdonella sp.]MCW5578332.1 AI-2E family transporter [Dokdonella sp.]
MPFAVAALFAYLFDPLVDRLERRLGRSWAVSLVFTLASIVLVAAVLLLVPFIEHQIGNFLGQLPVWVAWLQTHALPWVQERFGVTPELLDTRSIFDALQKHWKEAGGLAASVIGQVSRSGMALVGWGLNLVMIPVVGFYLLRDWDVLVARVHELIPRSVEPVVSRLARESDEVLGAFLRGQLSVMIVLGLFYGVALWLVGINVGPLIGMIAGLISFVPYLGAIAGVLMGVIAALVQYQDWTHVMLVLGVFVVGQTLEGYVLVPRLVGDRIGLHPVAVIFAVLAGGELFGFLGILLALPVAAVVMVLLRYLHQRYTGSALYRHGERPAVATPAEAVAAAGAGEVTSAAAAQPAAATGTTPDAAP